MSKIKFNKEWYNNNKVAIHCKTEDESILLTRELHKVDIEVNWDMFSVYDRYENKTCYDCSGNWISYANIGYYIDKDYTIIKFSDLEFESEYELNEYNLEYKKLDSSFNKLKDVISANLPKKSEPIIETNEQYKRTILRCDVELKSGDVIAVQSYLENSEPLCYGIILNNNILYNDGNFDKTDSLQDIIDEDLVWYIKAEDYISLGGYISELLFKGELDDELKDSAVHVQDKPKEPIKKEVEMAKYINLDKLNEILHNDKREAFSKHQVWLLLNYHKELVVEIGIDRSNDKNEINETN